MKTLLLYPPAYANRYKPRRACFPLGIAYLAAVLRQHGKDVSVLDCVVEGFDDFTPVPESRHYYIYGLYGKKLRERLERDRPDVLGISCPYYSAQKTVLEIARLAKEIGIKWVVLGGQHASGLAEYFLSFPQVDFIIVGEGERSLLKLVETLEAGQPDALAAIDGLAYKAAGNIVRNPKRDYIQDLDSIPFPARDLFPMEKYFTINVPSGLTSLDGRATEFISSRGCPHHCSFCASTVFGGNFRGRSPENIIAEMRELKNRYGVREIQFIDDNILHDRDRIMALCRRMIEERINLKLGLPNAVGSFALDEELIQYLAGAGLYFTHLSVESGNQKVLTQIMHKPTRVDQTSEVVRLLRRHQIDVTAVFCVGNPGETLEDIRQTFDYAATLPVYEAFFYFATPLPGTELYQICRQEKYIPDNFLDLIYDFQEPAITTPAWTPARLKRFVRRKVFQIYLSFFWKDPIGFIIRYIRRYRKNTKVFLSLGSFLVRD